MFKSKNLKSVRCSILKNKYSAPNNLPLELIKESDHPLKPTDFSCECI